MSYLKVVTDNKNNAPRPTGRDPNVSLSNFHRKVTSNFQIRQISDLQFVTRRRKQAWRGRWIRR